ncbi:hypothetical protein M231_06130 [Tremella mesenterica]|uniref:Uncharacterized protein n=1 Tax=Tremella mesenterica TaxID=5217 RepID=A0A4Q1BCM2_TREME|nr:hypothetical protein M231_06130 [Tremella mesenterica]
MLSIPLPNISSSYPSTLTRYTYKYIEMPKRAHRSNTSNSSPSSSTNPSVGGSGFIRPFLSQAPSIQRAEAQDEATKSALLRLVPYPDSVTVHTDRYNSFFISNLPVSVLSKLRQQTTFPCQLEDLSGQGTNAKKNPWTHWSVSCISEPFKATYSVPPPTDLGIENLEDFWVQSSFNVLVDFALDITEEVQGNPSWDHIRKTMPRHPPNWQVHLNFVNDDTTHENYENYNEVIQGVIKLEMWKNESGAYCSEPTLTGPLQLKGTIFQNVEFDRTLEGDIWVQEDKRTRKLVPPPELDEEEEEEEEEYNFEEDDEPYAYHDDDNNT